MRAAPDARHDPVAPDTLPLDTIDRWIATLDAVPADARVYEVVPRRAELEFGISPAIAAVLCDRGLARTHVDGEVRYAWSDLHYIALRLGSARVYLKTMHSWANALTGAEQSRSPAFAVRYRTYATPGVTAAVLLPARRRVKTVVGADQIVASFEVRPANDDVPFPPVIQRVLQQAAGFDFYLLPAALAGDVEFARRTGLAGCMTASRFVVSECRALGIEARMAYGLLLSRPLATPHEWAEIRLADTWVPADPLLLTILARFAGLDASRWPCTRSPRSVLLHLAGSKVPIVEGPTGPLQTSFPVELTGQAR